MLRSGNLRLKMGGLLHGTYYPICMEVPPPPSPQPSKKLGNAGAQGKYKCTLARYHSPIQKMSLMSMGGVTLICKLRPQSKYTWDLS